MSDSVRGPRRLIGEFDVGLGPWSESESESVRTIMSQRTKEPIWSVGKLKRLTADEIIVYSDFIINLNCTDSHVNLKYANFIVNLKYGSFIVNLKYASFPEETSLFNNIRDLSIEIFLHLLDYISATGVGLMIEKLRPRFIWGADDTKRKIHWISLEKVIASKKEGWLGVGSLKALNIALLTKWCWRLKNDGGCLWRDVIISIA
ncbi:hypothetical protein LXL04_033974 [Taraxacum kok-saghyz]